MSQHDPNYKRLGLIVMLFVLLLFIFACQKVFTGDGSYDEMTGNLESKTNVAGERVDIVSSFNFVGFILEFFGFFFGFMFITFNLSPVFAIIILPIYTVLLVVFWLLIIDIFTDVGEILIKIADAIIPF